MGANEPHVFPHGAAVGVLVLLLVASWATATEAQSADTQPVPGHLVPGHLVPGHVLNTAVHPLNRTAPTTVEAKVPLLEVFTATWCPPCAPEHNAVERLLAERSPGLAVSGSNEEEIGLGVLSYHPFPDIGAEDPFGIPEGHERLTKKHNAFWFPSAYVDGAYEDAPQTRTVQVDVGMEETLYSSYSGLIERAAVYEPPFTMRVASVRVADDPAAWNISVRVEVTGPVPPALVMQGVLWEDPVRFLGSNGVDRHRMVVRAMAPPEEAPGDLAGGGVWETTLHVVAPAGVDPERAGIVVLVETPWGEERDDRVAFFFTFALFVAGGCAVTAAWQIHAQGQKRKGRRGGAAQGASG